MYSTNSGRTVPKCRCNAVNCSGILSASGNVPSVSKKKTITTSMFFYKFF